MTGTRSKTKSESEVHILDSFMDDKDCYALTLLVKDFRFHIMVSPDDLASSSDGDHVAKEYLSLIRAVKVRADESENNDDNPDSAYRPGTIPKEDNDDKSNKREQRSANQDSDSGVDVRDDATSNDDKTQTGNEEPVQVNEDVEVKLHEWMLKPVSNIFDALPSISDDGDLQSLIDWYSGPTYFYTLHGKDGELDCQQLEASEELEERIKNLIPKISIPKYIKRLDIPWYNASDIIVLAESDDPAPYRPCQVQAGGDKYYLKTVDRDQPQPTRREIKLMKEIESKRLHEKMRVPLVTGLVGWEDSKSEIMGFLMTNIEDPTPLTRMLDSDVVEEKREKWARETERMVKLLHDNDIVWGDAKADNFMVDRHGDLWIIDFGGSYTDGWVDPELMETEEGDDMGVEKIVNALEDPEANTYDPTEEVEQMAGNKRAADDSTSDADSNTAGDKRRKLSNTERD
ncbi:hypothetical protein PFICI_14811 [Pestalotiopsis fici W106-1]|uniref:Protein kinase domain-containing protein n=1 Tax=Pestalotiopsis fici (strain W106-1 / CGMCC3.15140) TaxID=1229662 RepID=W3WIW3_PESFW|nr:uncharacterized protein PFICI_14811 [Pestalotiopsis fici W106-1]ETS73865.1 hypothetical protein PFICI_14811 [Pestalotiopsis fici W106-1]